MDDEDEVDEGQEHEENMTHDPQEVHLDTPILDGSDSENQVNFIDLESQTPTELQVHQIFCTNEDVPESVATEHVIELPSGGNTYAVLSDGQITTSAISDFSHQTTSLATEGATVESIGNEAQLSTANLQWYVQDVVNSEPWQNID